MKPVQYLITTIISSILLWSCADSGEHASSTPVDSTNVHGTAPATYGAVPVDTIYPKYEGQHDDGLRANTVSEEDSLAGRK